MRTLTRITLIAGILFMAGCDPQAAEEAAENAAAEAEKQAQAAADQAEQAAAKAGQAAKEAEGAAADALKQAEGTAADALNQAEGAAGELGGKLGALGDELGAEGQKALDALKGVEGGNDLMTKINELFTSTTKTLSGVNNEATAQAAVPELEQLSLSAEKLKPLLEGLPAEAKTAVTGLIDKGIPKLEMLVKSIYAIPGVEAALKPKLDELMTKLTALTGKPPA